MGAGTITGLGLRGMGKKKPKVTLFVEIDPALKARIDNSAERNGRKLNAEVSRALEYYLAAHEPRDDEPKQAAK